LLIVYELLVGEAVFPATLGLGILMEMVGSGVRPVTWTKQCGASSCGAGQSIRAFGTRSKGLLIVLVELTSK
jgi:hypothetical protein